MNTNKHSRKNILKALEAFHNSDLQILRIEPRIPEEYASLVSASNSWRCSIRTSKYHMVVRTIYGSLYIIKMDPDYKREICKLCKTCLYSLSDGYYNPDAETCKTCVNCSHWEKNC